VIIGTTMYAVGRIAKVNRMAELGLHGTEALAVGELTGHVLKGMLGRQRPYVQPRNPHSYGFLRGFGGGDQFRSFPSGHTVAAFAAASAVTSQTSNWWPNSRILIGTALYGGAALTGISRMYDNRHWASDVIMGAGIGTFAGLKVVRFNSSHSGNRLDRWLLSGSVTPTPDGGRTLRWSLMPGIAIGEKPPKR
jgi:membrane-associated phospholipid phosphatase